MIAKQKKQNVNPFAQYVHGYRGRWIVAEYRDGRYYAPQRPDVRRQTGCHTTFGPLAYVAGDGYSYTRRSAALRRARVEFGIWEELTS